MSNSNENAGINPIPSREHIFQKYIDKFVNYKNISNLTLDTKLKFRVYNFQERCKKISIASLSTILTKMFNNIYGEIVFATVDITQSVVEFILKELKDTDLHILPTGDQINIVSRYKNLRKICSGAKIDIENPDSFLDGEDVVDPELEFIQFDIEPNPLVVEKGKSINYNLTGEIIDSYTHQSMDESKFTATENSVTGVEVGDSQLKIIAKKANYKDTEKLFNVQVVEEVKLPTDLSIEENPTDVSLYESETKDLRIITDAATYSIGLKNENPDFLNNNIINNPDTKTITIKGAVVGNNALIITAQAENCLETSIELPITIKQKGNTELTADQTSISLYKNKEMSVNFTTNASDIRVETENNDYYDIEKTGKTLKIIPKAPGNKDLVVKAQAENCNEASLTIPVEIKELENTELSVNKENIEIFKDDIDSLTVTTNAPDFSLEGVENEFARIERDGNNINIAGLQPGDINLIIKAQVENGNIATKVIPIKVKERMMTELTVQPESGDIFKDEELELTVTTNAPDFSYEEVENLSIRKENNKLYVSSLVPNTYNLKIKAITQDALEASQTISINIKELIETTISTEPTSLLDCKKGKTTNLTVTTNAPDFSANSKNNKFSINKEGNILTLTFNEVGDDVLVLTAKADHGVEKTLEINLSIEDLVFILGIEGYEEPNATITKTESRKFKINTNSISPISIRKVSGNITLDDSTLESEKAFSVLGDDVGSAIIEIKTLSIIDNSESILNFNINVEKQPETFLMNYLAMGLSTELNYIKNIAVLFNGTKEELNVEFAGCTGEVVEISDFPEYTESVSGNEEFLRLMSVITGESLDGPTVTQGKLMLEQNKSKAYLVKLKITSVVEGSDSNTRTVTFSGTANSIYASGPAQPVVNQINIVQDGYIDSLVGNVFNNMDRNVHKGLIEDIENPIATLIHLNNEDLELTSNKPDTTTIKWLPGSLFYGLNVYAISIDQSDQENREITIKIKSSEFTSTESFKIYQRVKFVYHKESGDQKVLQANVPNKFIIDEFTGDNITRNSLSGSAMGIDFSNVILEVAPDLTYFTLQVNTEPKNAPGGIGGSASKKDGSLVTLEWEYNYDRIE